jgi:hypothetical protein
MRQVVENLQSMLHNGVTFFTFYVRDEPNATCIVFVGGVVEPLSSRVCRMSHGFASLKQDD